MKHTKILALITAALLLLASCTADDSENTSSAADHASKGEISSDRNTSSEASRSPSEASKPFDSSEVSETQNDISEMFTERDLLQTYDTEGGVRIDLSSGSVTGDGAKVSGGNVAVTKEGTYIITGSTSNGQIIVDADENAKIQLVLDGVSITSATSAPVYVRSAHKVFLTTSEGSENTLKNGGKYIAIDDSNIDSVIFAKCNLTLCGKGKLTVESSGGHGVVSKDDLRITGGEYRITAGKHALSGKDSVRIAGGSLTLNASEDGVHAENKDDGTKGFVYISGGDIKISAADDGIHAANSLMICGGDVNIEKSDEGIEGLAVRISSGSVRVNSSDDGINAASSGQGGKNFGFGGSTPTEGAEIDISGGVINISAGGDGLDSNGGISVSGGSLFISCPAFGDTSPIDSEKNAVITGGTVVAAGSMGMAENFGGASTQCAMLVNINGSAGGDILLCDSAGREILSYRAERAFGCVIISSPDIKVGETYTVKCGNNQASVSMTSTIYGGKGGFPPHR